MTERGLSIVVESFVAITLYNYRNGKSIRKDYLSFIYKFHKKKCIKHVCKFIKHNNWEYSIEWEESLEILWYRIIINN